MLPDQTSLPLSAYSELYDKLISPTNRLRQIKDLVDFSFVYRTPVPCYSHVNGRVTVNPILAFKYLLLKVIFDLSDVDVVDHSRYDLSFKYFLDLSPEADVINPSTLSRFRRQRLKDRFPLELLVGQTVHLAGGRGLLDDRAVILDTTHTLSRYTASSARVALEGRYRRLLSTLRDSVALTGEGLSVSRAGEVDSLVATGERAVKRLGRDAAGRQACWRDLPGPGRPRWTQVQAQVLLRLQDTRGHDQERHHHGGGSDHGREGGRSIPAIAGGAESTQRRGGGNRHRRHGLLRSG